VLVGDQRELDTMRGIWYRNAWWAVTAVDGIWGKQTLAAVVTVAVVSRVDTDTRL
jgi:hypothetical protein